ncbi:energy transducer TonB [Sphingobacterium sp. HMA12]|uniref:energy transducer TonB n=1 Tax=Sphingobacterium sp. HMA12 TaxID=2050894 RepID=UPI000CE9B205|nr:energy transducer TonB [Sphingobacterium sp. HMA12]
MKINSFNLYRYFLYIIFLCFVMPSKAQETIVTYIKKNGGHTALKDSALYTNIIRLAPNEMGLYELNDYYANGNLKRHGWTKIADPRKLHLEGLIETYYENGNLATSAEYKDNRLSDTLKRYHKNGLLRETRFFFRSENHPNEFLFPDKNSRLIYYADSTGHVQISGGNGTFEFKNKKDTERGQYANGVREGLWEGTFHKGKNRFEEWYENGTLTKAFTTDSTGNKHPYTQREVQPEYPGGIKKLMTFIAQNYNYPKEALNARVSGQLLISFVIETTGIPSEFKVINDLGYGTAASGIEVIQKAKKWTPGYQFGLPVRVQYSLPIRLNTLPKDSRLQ